MPWPTLNWLGGNLSFPHASLRPISVWPWRIRGQALSCGPSAQEPNKSPPDSLLDVRQRMWIPPPPPKLPPRWSCDLSSLAWANRSTASHPQWCDCWVTPGSPPHPPCAATAPHSRHPPCTVIVATTAPPAPTVTTAVNGVPTTTIMTGTRLSKP
jgi:hypothetical protein